MADITLPAAPVTWPVANQIQGPTARGANGYIEFEAEAVAVLQGGLTWLPSPQRAEMIDGEMNPIDLPINDPDVWNWKVTPRLGVRWPSFHVNVEEGGTNLSSAAIVPGKGPVRVLQGPRGGSVVGAEDQGDGTIRFVLDDGTRTAPVPITRGPAGPANRIEIGTVMRGEEAYASLVGEAPNQVLHLTLPKGDPGDPEDLIDATPDQRGLMSAADKAHLDDTPTRGEVVTTVGDTLTNTYSLADNFENLAPRYVTRLDVRGNNVMQGFARDSLGRYYLTQVHGSDGDMSVTRTDAGGRALDSALLIGGGHGSPWGFEEQDDGIYMWVWWNAEVGGRTDVLRRWKYTPGATVSINDPSVEKMPDFVSNVEGFRQVDTSINQRLDLLSFTVRTTVDGVSQDRAQMRRLSDYKAGVDRILSQSPPIPLTPNGALQGHVVTEEHFYLHRGMSGSWPQSPHMDQYRWSDGERVGQIDLSHLPYGGAGGAPDGSEKAEAEGLFPVWDRAGRMSLLFGIATGRNAANQHNIYSIAPTDFQSDTGIGQSVQRLFAPLHWVDVPLKPGFEYRDAGNSLQVARDSHGMVHLRGHMANTGMTDLTGQVVFATVPREYLPDREVRWLAWATARSDDVFGGWISSASGDVVLQNRVGKTAGPQSHFAIIAQPWQARA